jgi:ubiquinol-cytochrome c reductase cytochrome c subunit
MTRSKRRTGRRHPLATAALLALGLVFTGGAYAAFSTTTAQAEPSPTSQETIEEGEKLFQANCASCHGLDAQGTGEGPSLIGVGAAAVDFQVGTGRMPMQMQGPQAQQKPPQFTDEQVKQLAYYVGSLGPGPDIPADSLVNGGGDAANGAELFRINCAMCHNVAGAGGALTEGKYAPALHTTTPLNMYAAMVTGPQNMPVFNDMTLTTEEKRDIITYLLYLQDNESAGGFTLGSLGPVSEGLFIWIFGIGSLIAITVWITAKSN